MNDSRRRWLIAGVVVLAVVVLLFGSILIGWLFFNRLAFSVDWQSPRRGPFTQPGFRLGQEFESNGERIYWTGNSESGPPVTAEVPGMYAMPSGMMTCVACHGPDGEGGGVRMMMQTFEAPNIQYDNLTSEGHGDEHEEHEPYTEETLRRAITEGVGPDGEPLEWMMPRWDMSDEQLDDLIDHLKTLE